MGKKKSDPTGFCTERPAHTKNAPNGFELQDTKLESKV